MTIFGNDLGFDFSYSFLTREVVIGRAVAAKILSEYKIYDSPKIQKYVVVVMFLSLKVYLTESKTKMRLLLLLLTKFLIYQNDMCLRQLNLKTQVRLFKRAPQ